MRIEIAVMGLAAVAFGAPDRAPVRILVWDEQQEAQKKAYPNYLGNHIVEYLKKQPDVEVRSVSFKDPEQGLSSENVDWADVVIWWGHQKHGQVKDEPVSRIVARLVEGKTGLVALHSAHYSKPFKAAMWERFKADVLAKHPEWKGAEFVRGKGGMPAVLKNENKDGKLVVTVTPPACGLGGVREDGQPGHLQTRAPNHPVAKGLPAQFDVPKTEMYNEPFQVPEPDTVVFFETWDKGEKFRSGCAWQVGGGRVFYFRPGHETFPVFDQEETKKIVYNAALWAAKRAP